MNDEERGTVRNRYMRLFAIEGRNCGDFWQLGATNLRRAATGQEVWPLPCAAHLNACADCQHNVLLYQGALDGGNPGEVMLRPAPRAEEGESE